MSGKIVDESLESDAAQLIETKRAIQETSEAPFIYTLRRNRKLNKQDLPLGATLKPMIVSSSESTLRIVRKKENVLPQGIEPCSCTCFVISGESSNR